MRLPKPRGSKDAARTKLPVVSVDIGKRRSKGGRFRTDSVQGSVEAHMSGAKVKGHCPVCGPGKWAEVRGEFKRSESNKDVSVSTVHRILQCPACENVYHQTNFTCSEDWDVRHNPATGDEEYFYDEKIEHWPPPAKRPRPSWLDRLPAKDTDLYRLLSDVYSAVEIDLDVLAAIGIRTTFDRGAELLSIDPARTFGQKLNDLVAAGYIGSTERDALAAMTDAGSASVHRGWKPTPQQLETMLQLIEGFVHRNFILRDDVSGLKNAVPARPRPRPP
jgi:hypothetical protein